MSEKEVKKSRKTLIALLIVVVVLLASLGGVFYYFTTVVNEKDSRIFSLSMERDALRTQISSLQSQIFSLQTQISSLKSQINEIKATKLDENRVKVRVEVGGKAGHNLTLIFGMRSRVDEVRLIDPPTIKRPREGYTFLIVEVKVINEGSNYFYPWQWLWGLAPPGVSSPIVPGSILVEEGYGKYREFPYPYQGAPIIPPGDVGMFNLLFEVERSPWYSSYDLVLGYYYPLFSKVYELHPP
jgi:multidrug efflux pump subunit AcrA (membrane-fusion protein)